VSSPVHVKSEASGSRGTLLLVTVVWGLNLPVLKWLTAHFDPVLLAALRMTAGALVLGCLLMRQPSLHRLPTGQWLRLLVAALLMVYVYQLLITHGIQRTSATNSALVSALHPLIASMVALVLLGERLRGRRLLGAIVGLAGVAVVIVKQPSAQLNGATAGDLFILAGLGCYCVGAVIAQRLLASLDALMVSMGTQVVGAALLVAHATAAAWWGGEPPLMAPVGWLWVALLLSGALSTGVSVLLWNRAMAAVGMARASMWLYWVPIFGVAAAVIFLGEPLTVWHILGLSLVMVGTQLATRVRA
jgi:drug/metabolite transporter (DMT)-like permease